LLRVFDSSSRDETPDKYHNHPPVLDDPGYELVRVASGAHSVHSLAYKETFHPVIGPVAEAEALYVRQTRLIERLSAAGSEFVIWDIGLGAAANPVTVLNSLTDVAAQCTRLKIISFDQTIEPLRFALSNVHSLPFLRGYEAHLDDLISDKEVRFDRRGHVVEWELHIGDFPSIIATSEARALPRPHLIMFDAYSPATNPSMWTLPLFTNIFSLLDPERPCLLPTYSRSTMLRVTLLLAGFFAGVGHPTGEKDETTVAANRFELIDEPLDRRWLQRVRRSTSAEPLHEAIYRQAQITQETREKLKEHPQWELTSA